MEELAAAAAGQQRVGGINDPRDTGTVARSWNSNSRVSEAQRGPKPTRNRGNPGSARGSERIAGAGCGAHRAWRPVRPGTPLS